MGTSAVILDHWVRFPRLWRYGTAAGCRISSSICYSVKIVFSGTNTVQAAMERLPPKHKTQDVTWSLLQSTCSSTLSLHFVPSVVANEVQWWWSKERVGHCPNFSLYVNIMTMNFLSFFCLPLVPHSPLRCEMRNLYGPSSNLSGLKCISRGSLDWISPPWIKFYLNIMY